MKDLLGDIERLNPIVSERSHRVQQHEHLLRSIEYYLGSLGASRAITLHKGPAPTPQKREGALDAVERCRRRLRELDADRHRIASAPWHAALAKERARAEIDALAERGQPSVLPLIESSDGSIYWSERAFTDAFIAGRVITAGGDRPAMPLLFWLHRDVIVAKVEAQIDAIADNPNALTAQQRAEQIGEIDRDRLAVERDEEHWIGIAIHDGVNVLRRADADARAVLSLASDLPAPSKS